FLTDATGAVTDSYDYDAWGSVVASTGNILNTRLFAGEEFDPDLGLINLRARQYKPETGRFLAIDPLMGVPRQPVTLNRYLYANGDPTNLVDPTGRLTAVEYGAIISGILLATHGAIAQFSHNKKLQCSGDPNAIFDVAAAVIGPFVPISVIGIL